MSSSSSFDGSSGLFCICHIQKKLFYLFIYIISCCCCCCFDSYAALINTCWLWVAWCCMLCSALCCCCCWGCSCCDWWLWCWCWSCWCCWKAYSSCCRRNWDREYTAGCCMWEGGPRAPYTGGHSPCCSITSNEKRKNTFSQKLFFFSLLIYASSLCNTLEYISE